MKKLSKKDVLQIKKNYSQLSYSEKIQKYEKLNNSTNFSCKNESDFKQVFGYCFNQIDGYEYVEYDTKKIVDRGILWLSNSGGMDYKADRLVYKIRYDMKGNRYKLYHCEGYSWLFRDGSIG